MDDVVWVAMSTRRGKGFVYHSRWRCRLPSRSLKDSGRVPTVISAAWRAGFRECIYCASGLPEPARVKRQK